METKKKTPSATQVFLETSDPRTTCTSHLTVNMHPLQSPFPCNGPPPQIGLKRDGSPKGETDTNPDHVLFSVKNKSSRGLLKGSPFRRQGPSKSPFPEV